MCVIFADCWHSAAQFKEAEDIIVEALNGLRDSGGMVNSSIASCVIRGMLEVHAPEALEGSKASPTSHFAGCNTSCRSGWAGHTGAFHTCPATHNCINSLECCLIVD